LCNDRGAIQGKLGPNGFEAGAASIEGRVGTVIEVEIVDAPALVQPEGEPTAKHVETEQVRQRAGKWVSAENHVNDFESVLDCDCHEPEDTEGAAVIALQQPEFGGLVTNDRILVEPVDVAGDAKADATAQHTSDGPEEAVDWRIRADVFAARKDEHGGALLSAAAAAIRGPNVQVGCTDEAIRLLTQVINGDDGALQIDNVLIVIEHALSVLPDVLIKAIADELALGEASTGRDEELRHAGSVVPIQRQLALAARRHLNGDHLAHALVDILAGRLHAVGDIARV
jgi:hypothetical protein